MSDRASRLAPLTGALFSVMVIASFAIGGETPKANASAAKVVAYYSAHKSKIEVSSVVAALAFVALVFFAGSLRSYMRRATRAEGAAALVTTGAALMLVGVTIVGGLEFGLAHELSSFESDASIVRALNFLSNELFVPILAGALVFGIASGVAILRGAELPNWLGWAVIVLGVITIVPPTSIAGLLGFVLWTLIVSILVYRRSAGVTEAPSEALAASV